MLPIVASQGLHLRMQALFLRRGLSLRSGISPCSLLKMGMVSTFPYLPHLPIFVLLVSPKMRMLSPLFSQYMYILLIHIFDPYLGLCEDMQGEPSMPEDEEDKPGL